MLATDAWLGKAILQREHPFHWLGVLFSEAAGREAELGLDADATPSYVEVLEVRAGLRVIFAEEWHHHRYALRDLHAITTNAPWSRAGRPLVVAGNRMGSQRTAIERPRRRRLNVHWR